MTLQGAHLVTAGAKRRLRRLLLAGIASAGLVAYVAAIGSPGVDVPAVDVPAVPQVFVIGTDGHGLRQLTSGSVSHSGVSWMSGSGAVADVASGGSNQWIESQSVDGTAHRVLSVKLRTTQDPPWPTLGFSPASMLTAVETYDENTRISTLAVVGDRRAAQKMLDKKFYDPDFPGGASETWSPDGRVIAYSRAAGPLSIDVGPIDVGPGHIAIVAPDWSGPRVLTHGSASDDPQIFSPDGRTLLFYRDGPSKGLYTIPTQGGRVHKLASGNYSMDSFAWSPNGRLIAFAGWWNATGAPHLFVMDVRSGRVRKLSDSVQAVTPAWSPDGTEIAFATWQMHSIPEPPEGYGAVATIKPDGTGAKALAQIPESQTLDLAWSPNGRQIAFTVGPPPPEG